MRALVLVGLLLASCSTQPANAPIDVNDAADADTAAPPAIDPALYDCRAKKTPARKSPVPHSCVTDPACTTRMISSHRGAGVPGVLAPENTLSALRASIALGADVVECDVRKTADGKLVLLHDATVDRTLEGTGSVASLTLAQIRALKVKAKDYTGDFGCETVPTLEEYLAIAAGKVQVIIDASKIDDTEAIVVEVQRVGAVAEVVIDAEGHPERLKKAADLDPKIPIAVRAKTGAELDAALAALPGRTPIWVHIGDASPAGIVPAIKAKGLRAFSLGFVADAIAEHEEVFVGAGYDKLYAEGITFIQSNRPDLVARFLRR